jgi:anti-sigma regulatory factor (Ser/Thr protein kinase)
MTTLLHDSADGITPTITLSARPECVSAVREHVRATLALWELDTLTDAAVLLASELATNAVRHAGAGRPVSVSLRREAGPDGGACVWVDVHDTDSHLPEVRTPGEGDDHGRGMLLVQALASAWESVLEPGGKCVRFRLDAGPA